MVSEDPSCFYGILYDINSKARGTEIYALVKVNEVVYFILVLKCKESAIYPPEILPSTSVEDQSMA